MFRIQFLTVISLITLMNFDGIYTKKIFVLKDARNRPIGVEINTKVGLKNIHIKNNVLVKVDPNSSSASTSKQSTSKQSSGSSSTYSSAPSTLNQSASNQYSSSEGNSNQNVFKYVLAGAPNKVLVKVYQKEYNECRDELKKLCNYQMGSKCLITVFFYKRYAQINDLAVRYVDEINGLLNIPKKDDDNLIENFCQDKTKNAVADRTVSEADTDDLARSRELSICKFTLLSLFKRKFPHLTYYDYIYFFMVPINHVKNGYAYKFMSKVFESVKVPDNVPDTVTWCALKYEVKNIVI